MNLMKKFFAILILLVLAISANAQDVYTVGYYNAGDGTIAALYKNGERLYTAHHANQPSKATRVTCNSQGDVYWWVNFYDYPEGTYNHSEVRINNQVYATTENHSEIHISDIYCLNDTLYYTGYQYNEDSVMVATVWKGADFATHWVIGNGIYPSYIRNVDIDKNTGIPYFCGYVINDKKRAAVWKAQELLNTFDQDSLNIYEEITQSHATKIAVANDHVYTIGSFDTDWPVNLSAIWEDNVLMHHYGPYEPTIHDLCTFEDSYYSAIADRWGDEILKNGQDQMLWIGYAFTMLSTTKSIYVIGEDFDYKYYVWKDFEKQFQIKDCDAINDACVFEGIQGLYEPITGNGLTIYPNPTKNVLFVETQSIASQPNQTYRITDLIGQTVLSGSINAETQQINIKELPSGMYFITVGGQTVKFVVK